MKETTRPRILIADDHVLIAEAFRKLLAAEFDVIATVHDGRTLIQSAQELRPDLVLVDIGMPLLNGLEAAQRIKRILPATKIVYVTMNQDTDLMEEAFRMGASAYLPKTSAGCELVNAIRVALAGELYLPPMFAYRTRPQDTLRCELLDLVGSRGLTDRQREVLQLLAEGKSMKEVAAVLKLTTRTVAFHKYRLMETLHLKNDAEVVQYAIRNRIIFS